MVSTSTASTSPSPAVAIASIVSSPPTPAAAVISTPAAADSSTPPLTPGAAAVNSTPTAATSVASILPVPTAANAAMLQAAAAGNTTLMGTAECMNVSEYFFADSSLTTRSPTTKLGSKRVYNDSPGSSVAKPLAQIRDERDTTRAERHNAEMLMRREDLELKRQQFEAYKLELKLKEQKMERMFSVDAEVELASQEDGD
ncbi:hypothetical protein GN244_ATG11621 [Phytophthora infestans]|nr:hypothetical protein GN244_ATG11621 [Phytophthora infestans]